MNSSYWLNTINIKKEIHLDRLLKNALKNNIDFRRCFYPMNYLPAFRKYANKEFDYSQSSIIYKQLICLPSGLNLEADQITAVCEIICSSTKA